KGRAARTIREYRAGVERLLADWLDRPLRDISPEMVKARHDQIAADIAARNSGGRRGGGPAIGASTANGIMRALRAIWNSAAKADASLPANPVKQLDAWFPEQRRKGVVKAAELAAFYQATTALPSTTARDYILLLLFTGLRRNEAAALRWE